MPDILNDARKKIDEINKKMAELFEQRMILSKQIADFKRENGLDVFCREREQQILKNSKNYINNPEFSEYYARVMQAIMDVSKEYQASKIYDGEMYINTRSACYRVTVGRGAFRNADKYFKLDRKVLIVTDSGIPDEYVNAVKSLCKEPLVYTFEKGEKSKCERVLFDIQKVLTDNCFDRSDCIVAIGGGVAGDIAGLSASIYMRGIDYYNIPTTLLSQVDSSIGGKTAINYLGKKNIIGTFYAPSGVIIDPDLLKSLPKREFASGMAEIIKMAATSSAELFEMLENAEGNENLDTIIYKALEIKKNIVEQDEKESNLRRILNFGHTIGHAIESTERGNLTHGECVALGMLPMTADSLRKRIIALLQKYSLPTHYFGDINAVSKAIRNDKKVVGNEIFAVYLEKIGCAEIQKSELNKVIDSLDYFKRGDKL